MSAADDGRSLGQLIASAGTELSALVRDEVALAKAELRTEFQRALSGGATAFLAAVLALMAVPLLSVAAALGLHNLGLGLAWAFTAVAGAYLLLALVLLLVVRARLRSLAGPEKSLASVQTTAALLRGVRPRPRGAHEEGREPSASRNDDQGAESVTRSTV